MLIPVSYQLRNVSFGLHTISELLCWRNKRYSLIYNLSLSCRSLLVNIPLKFEVFITFLSWWVVFMSPTIDSRIKTPNVGIPLLQTEYEVRAAEHNVVQVKSSGSHDHAHSLCRHLMKGCQWADEALMHTDSLRDQHATSPPPIPHQQIIQQKGPPGTFWGNSTQINHSPLTSKTEDPQILPTSFS